MGMLVDLVNFILVIVLIVGIVVLAGVFLLKTGKVKIKKNEDEVDYTQIRRKDVRDYVKFDAIIAAKEYDKKTNNEDGVIVLDNGNRFVAGIEVKGFNFYNASRQVQAETIGGMQRFIEVFKSPIQSRQSTKKVDLSEKMKYYEHKAELLNEELEDLKVELFQLIQKKERYTHDEEAQAAYDVSIKATQKKIVAKEWSIRECIACFSYLDASANVGALERYQCYFYEWTYDPMLYSADTLSREEIYANAISELETMGNIYIDSLRACSVYGHRMTKKDLIAEMRAHNQPLTSRDYPFETFWENSVGSDTITGI